MKKISGSKKSGKKLSFIKIIDLLLMIIFAVMTILLIFNIIQLSNIENLLRGIVIVVLGLLLIGMFFLGRWKKKTFRVIVIILCLAYGFVNYAFYRVYASLDNITSKVDTKGICLATNLDNIDSIDDIGKEDIAIVGSSMDEQFCKMAEEVLDDEDLSNKLVEYDGYFEIIEALLKGEVKYAFLPENYNDIYKAGNSEEEGKDLDFKVLYSAQKEIVKKEEEVSTKMLDEPFTILLMGTDALLDSYNADTLMVLSVNPKTLKVTMLSIPRDTYATIACTGGKHKINASGWYGDSCVVKTVAKYLGVNIDYYAKINFLGIVDLVDNLGGVEVEVPYALCEQNSKRQFGEHMIFVDAGLQTLNGEQALALSRNRHYWKGLCPAKYTSDGNRSDLMRGQNQQLVIKAILSKLMSVRDLNQFYDILDTVGDNMTTNMSKETILSFYNVGKSIVKKFNTSNADDIINIEKLTFKSYFATIFASGMQLSMIVNYDESVSYVSNQMKKNLGLVKEEVIKTVSFDINEDYDPNTVKFNKLSSSLELLPNFVGKSLGEAISYCNKKALKCEGSRDDNGALITSQSISYNTDISIIRNKTIKFGVEAVVDKPVVDEPVIDDSNADNSTTDEPNVDDNGSTENNNPSTDVGEDDKNTSGDSSLEDKEDNTEGGSEDTGSDNKETPPENGDETEDDGGSLNEEA